MDLVCLAFFLVTSCAIVVDSENYKGYKLVSVFAGSKKEVEFLRELQMEYFELDFWTGPSLLRASTMLTPPHLIDTIKSSMTRKGLKWNELDADVQQIVENGMRKTPVTASARTARSTENTDIIDHTNYHTYDTIVAYVHQLRDTYPENVEVSYLTFPTHEGRRVAMMKLHGDDDLSYSKPSIVVEAGIHAREWISPASTLYSVEKILQHFRQGDPKARLMLNTYDWYIVPVTNPDGYEYTHMPYGQRLWRKNRRLMEWYCRGVDLNRNFDVYFGTTGVSEYCEHIIFHGFGAFSEPEAANIKHLFNSVNDSVIAFLSVHSYAQVILVPWSYSPMGQEANNSAELYRIADMMAHDIKDVDGKEYQVGLIIELLNYAASGTSTDWALVTKPGVYSLTFELRPDTEDERGFNLPPEEIIPTGKELLVCLETIAKDMKPIN